MYPKKRRSVGGLDCVQLRTSKTVLKPTAPIQWTDCGLMQQSAELRADLDHGQNDAICGEELIWLGCSGNGATGLAGFLLTFLQQGWTPSPLSADPTP